MSYLKNRRLLFSNWWECPCGNWFLFQIDHYQHRWHTMSTHSCQMPLDIGKASKNFHAMSQVQSSYFFKRVPILWSISTRSTMTMLMQQSRIQCRSLSHSGSRPGNCGQCKPHSSSAILSIQLQYCTILSVLYRGLDSSKMFGWSVHHWQGIPCWCTSINLKYRCSYSNSYLN